MAVRSIARFGRPLRLGTRGSQLARIQSGLIADALRGLGAELELVTIVTAGDRRAPDTAWGEGAFVTALGEALLAGEIDLAVHSAKDVPIEEDVQRRIAAYPERLDARDALVLPVAPASRGGTERDGARAVPRTSDGRSGALLDRLPVGAAVGTDSPRRTGFLRAIRPDLRFVPLHGNVDTRLRRLDAGEVDALVLAVAGLTRLGRANRISVSLPADLVPPAPGQGALAVEVRPDDEAVREIVAALDHEPTRIAVTAERIVLDTTGGGCRAPVGALASVHDGVFELVAGAVSQDGSSPRFVHLVGTADEAETLAVSAGRSLVSAGVVR